MNYIKLKDENKSDEYFEISKKLDSKYIEFVYNKAQYYIFKEKFDNAIELLNNHKDGGSRNHTPHYPKHKI